MGEGPEKRQTFKMKERVLRGSKGGNGPWGRGDLYQETKDTGFYKGNGKKV